VNLGPGPPGPRFTPDPAPARAAGRGRAWYRGDLHTHTVHSDGRRTLGELAADARAAGLDFLASTEHNTPSASLNWGGHAGPDLLVIDGREVTTRDGHWLALGLPPAAVVDWRYRAADGALDGVLAGLHGQDGLAVAAHPFNPCLGCGWRFGYRGLDAVEVWNGPWTPDDEAALERWDRLLATSAGTGRFLPAVGGSDTHGREDRVGLPQNVVLADGLDRRAVLDALRAGRCWLAASAAVDLRLEAAAAGRSAGIGGRLEVPPGQPVTVRLEVAGAAGCLARLCTDIGPALEARLGAGHREPVEWTTTAAAAAWVRAEVRRPPPAGGGPGEMTALTNPVFLGAPVSGRPRA
jgi:predicted metal-dependent phosphoesterase TrpH